MHVRYSGLKSKHLTTTLASTLSDMNIVDTELNQEGKMGSPTNEWKDNIRWGMIQGEGSDKKEKRQPVDEELIITCATK